MLALFKSAKIIFDWLEIKNLEKHRIWFYFLALLLAVRFIRDNIHFLQITIVILYLALEGMWQIKNGNIKTGAALIALGINIKILPIILIPYLIFRKEFKAFVWLILFYILFMAIPILFIGWERNMVLLQSWWNLINPSNSQHLIDVEERSFHSLTTLIPTLFMQNVPDVYALPIKRNIADLSLSSVTLIIHASRLFMIALSLYFFKSMPLKKESNSNKQLLELSYLFLVIPLIFPHQQFYAFLFAVPAALFVLHFLFTQYQNLSKLKRNILITLFCLSFLLMNAEMFFGFAKDYIVHFKLLTYGALLLVACLAICSNKKEGTITSS